MTHKTNQSEMQQPLRVMFVITSMPVGGAETLLVNLVRSFDRRQVEPYICCLKEPGELGEQIRSEIPLFSQMINGRYDIAVIRRLRQLFKQHAIDAVITVGAGDKMFWGRLAAKYAGVPVILSALHSTGWPDGVGRMNRMLTRITDGFIAVAENHRKYLVENENFPAEKVKLIPNGINTCRFEFNAAARNEWRQKLGIPNDGPVCGIIAALRPEKNHELFLKLADHCGRKLTNAHFLIVGDGPRRQELETLAAKTEVAKRIHFLGSRSEIPQILSAVDLFALTSHNEASPVSILEAMSCSRPVVAPDVGSISQAVIDGETGYLFEAGDFQLAKKRWLQLLSNSDLVRRLGNAGRSHVEAYGSLESMTRGYEELVREIFNKKWGTPTAKSVDGNQSPIITQPAK